MPTSVGGKPRLFHKECMHCGCTECVDGWVTEFECITCCERLWKEKQEAISRAYELILPHFTREQIEALRLILKG